MERNAGISERQAREVMLASAFVCAIEDCAELATSVHRIEPGSEASANKTRNMIALCERHLEHAEAGKISVEELKHRRLELSRGSLAKAREPGQAEWPATPTQKVARRLYDEGYKAFKVGDYPAARTAFAASMHKESASVTNHILHRVELDLSGLTAIDNAQHKLRERGLSADPELEFKRGVLCLRMHNPASALEALAMAERLRKEQGLDAAPEIEEYKGHAHYKNKHFKSALTAFNESVRLRGSLGLEPDPELHEAIGDTYERFKRYIKALAAYELAQSLRHEQGLGRDPKCEYKRCEASMELRRYRQALVYITEADRLQRLTWPLPDGHYIAIKGRLCMHQGLYEEAYAAFETAIADREAAGVFQEPANWTQRARALFELGRYQEALAEFDECIKQVNHQLQWPDREVFIYRGLTLYRLGHKKRALAALKVAAQKLKHWKGLIDPQLYYRWARLMQECGDMTETRRLARAMKAVSIEREQRIPKQVVKWLREIGEAV